ncbi:MAG TPA: hypothetical protein PK240_07740, partial [Comamonas denitrificans]|nr:hypothetical protein [Comamonas denitrificans]
MSLALDARRLAMLEAMGITLWVPEAVAPAAPVPTAQATRSTLKPAPHAAAPRPAVAGTAPSLPQSQSQSPQSQSAPAGPRPARPVPAPRRAPAAPPPTVTPATPVAAVAPAQAAEVWQLAPAVHLYPDASGPASGGPWLILLESTHPATPLAGAVGDLLDKMLRALGLHQHPQVWLAVLQRPGGLPMAAEMAGSLAPVDWQPLPAQLAHTLKTVQPARVLLLGQKVAQTVLERHEPVGQLRQQRFDLAG